MRGAVAAHFFCYFFNSDTFLFGYKFCLGTDESNFKKTISLVNLKSFSADKKINS
jgi:hypothetical protein